MFVCDTRSKSRLTAAGCAAAWLLMITAAHAQARQVVARERGGMMVPLEKRPSMEIVSAPGFGVTPMAGVTHGTEVTVVK